MAIRFPSRAPSLLLLSQLVLGAMFLGEIRWILRVLPAEGVKLHGNVNTGVDLLGARTDILWLAGLGGVVLVGNAALAWLVASRDAVASAFLLAATVPVFLLLIGGLLVVARLNHVF